MRESIKSIGMVAVLILACVSIPLSIMSIVDDLEEKQVYHTATFYNQKYQSSKVNITLSLKENDVFSYSFYIYPLLQYPAYVFALTIQQLDGRDFDNYSYGTNWWHDVKDDYTINRGNSGSGYYQVNASATWIFFFTTGSEWGWDITITYTIFN